MFIRIGDHIVEPVLGFVPFQFYQLRSLIPKRHCKGRLPGKHQPLFVISARQGGYPGKLRHDPMGIPWVSRAEENVPNLVGYGSKPVG